MFKFTPRFVIKSFSIALLAMMLGGGAQAWGQSSKLGMRFVMRMDKKEKAASLSKSARDSYLKTQGISATSLSSETSVIYVKAPLTQADRDALRKQGIDIVDWIYVPPLKGSHPYGYYLGSVDFSAVPLIEKDSRIVSVETAENPSSPKNDLARQMLKTDLVQAGTGLNSAYNGTGVKIAIADSGIDLTHADFPTPVETYDMTTGTGVGTWSTTVANTVTDHGTHVTGSVLGRGTLSGGQYAGGAPAADLYFYKIGNDTDGTSTDADEIEAIQRAVAVGCDIFSMSYGGYDPYGDGSDAVSQAIDTAFVNDNLVSFIAAGNDGAANRHYSEDLAPATVGPTFTYGINNATSGTPYTAVIQLFVQWRDDTQGDYNVTMTATGLGSGESFADAGVGTSSRGTEAHAYDLTVNVPANTTNMYTLQLTNAAVLGTTPKVHVYDYTATRGYFTSPDPSYTITYPAVADDAIAVGAVVQRLSWTDWNGNTLTQTNPAYVIGQLAPFSSRGPRIDGTIKPDIVAPGCYTISTRDSVFSTNSNYRIDNDGLNLDGSGPADYYIKAGTSMATPMAAGSAGTIIQAYKDNALSYTASDVRDLIQGTADPVAKAANGDTGYGLMNTQAAAIQVENDAATAGVDDWIMLE